MSSGPDIIYYSAVQWDDFCFLIHSITAYNVQCSAMECKNNTVQCSVRCSRECNVQGSTVQCPVQLFSAIYSAIVQCNVQRNAVIRTRVCKCLGEWPLSFGKSSLLLQEVPSASLHTQFFNIKVILKVQRPEQSLAKSSGPEFPWTSSVIYYVIVGGYHFHWCVISICIFRYSARSDEFSHRLRLFGLFSMTLKICLLYEESSCHMSKRYKYPKSIAKLNLSYQV